MPKLSVVIVAYKSRETIERCVSSLPAAAEIIVVENQAREDNIDESRLPASVRFIRNDANLGFGRACNQGLKEAAGDYVLILNPDAWADTPDDAVRLVDFLDQNPDAVAVGARLLLPDGSVQPSCANRLTLGAVFLEQSLLEKVFGRYWIDTSRDTTARKVPQVTGACFAMRRIDAEFLRFDDRFFLYCEDTELMKRLAEHGDIYHLPTAVFHHELGSSSSKNRWFAVACYNRGKELYFQIHHGKFAGFICFLLNRAGALLRLVIWFTATIFSLGRVTRFRENFVTFVRTLFAPLDVFAHGLGDDRPNPQS